MTDEDIQEKSYVRNMIFFSIGSFIYFLFRYKSGNYYVNKAIIEISVPLFFLISGTTLIWISRYYQPHVTVNNFSGSISGRPVLIPDKGPNGKTFYWAIFSTGSYFGGAIEGKLATLIIPWNQVNQVGRNYVAKTFVKKIYAEKLGHTIYQFLYDNRSNYNLKKVYFGYVSDKFYHSDKEDSDLQKELDAKNILINRLEKNIQRDNESMKEEIETAKELVGSNDSFWNNLNFFKKSSDSEEE